MATNAESGKSSLKIFLGSLFVVILLIAVFLSQNRKTADLAGEQPATSPVTSPTTKMKGRGEGQISEQAELSSHDAEQSSPHKQSESVRAKRRRANMSNGRRSDSSAELIPVLTGGAGAHHSLGGGASLGGH